MKPIWDDAGAQIYVSKYCAKVESVEPQTVYAGESMPPGYFQAMQDAYSLSQTQEKTIGRHWGRIGKPDESPIAEFTCSEQTQAVIKRIVVGWVSYINDWYALKLHSKPDYITYQVYGLKGHAMLIILHELFPIRPKSPNPFDGYRQ